MIRTYPRAAGILLLDVAAFVCIYRTVRVVNGLRGRGMRGR